jgi:SAM-dependent methyltransferase
MLRKALKKQYARTMREAYASARAAAVAHPADNVLDCGSGSGHERVATFGSRGPDNAAFRYCGLEWNKVDVERGRAAGLDIREADLNRRLPVDNATQGCVIAYSVLEHLLMPCSFLSECHRVLQPGGRLVILTPNISTYFTALQVLFGRMPSSGPHPDSNWLIQSEQPEQVSEVVRDNVSTETPQHRHLVVFSLRVLRKFLVKTGFSIEQARGFGYYPLPISVQPFFERIDAPHCHQMVLVCTKRTSSRGAAPDQEPGSTTSAYTGK